VDSFKLGHWFVDLFDSGIRRRNDHRHSSVWPCIQLVSWELQDEQSLWTIVILSFLVSSWQALEVSWSFHVMTISHDSWNFSNLSQFEPNKDECLAGSYDKFWVPDEMIPRIIFWEDLIQYQPGKQSQGRSQNWTRRHLNNKDLRKFPTTSIHIHPYLAVTSSSEKYPYLQAFIFEFTQGYPSRFYCSRCVSISEYHPKTWTSQRFPEIRVPLNHPFKEDFPL